MTFCLILTSDTIFVEHIPYNPESMIKLINGHVLTVEENDHSLEERMLFGLNKGGLPILILSNSTGLDYLLLNEKWRVTAATDDNAP